MPEVVRVRRVLLVSVVGVARYTGAFRSFEIFGFGSVDRLPCRARLCLALAGLAGLAGVVVVFVGSSLPTGVRG